MDPLKFHVEDALSLISNEVFLLKMHASLLAASLPLQILCLTFHVKRLADVEITAGI